MTMKNLVNEISDNLKKAIVCGFGYNSVEVNHIDELSFISGKGFCAICTGTKTETIFGHFSTRRIEKTKGQFTMTISGAEFNSVCQLLFWNDDDGFWGVTREILYLMNKAASTQKKQIAYK